MEFSIKSGSPEKQRSACIVVGVFEPRKLTAPAELIDGASKGYLSDIVRRGDMEGKAGRTLLLHNVPGLLGDRVMLVGLGREKDFREREYREAIRAAVKTLDETGAFDGSIYLTEVAVKKRDVAWRVRQAAITALETVYRFDSMKSRKDEVRRPVRKLTLMVERRNELGPAERAVREGEAIGHGMSLARDLGNLPGNVCTPEYLATRARDMAKAVGIKCEVLERADCEALKMGSFLSVANGSRQAPKFIILEYRGGKDDEKPIVLIGKGVTFDTGGISIKPAAGMEDMKGDMGGAACVTGLMHALAARKAKVNAIGAIGLVENMPDGNAQRPGDIVRSMSGQTIEIINTDAEGRLVLGDVLWHVKEKYKPAFMIDLATLTGAILVALGQEHAGLFSNSDELSTRLLAAGEATGETVWRMPLGPAYDKMIDSKFADMKNTGGRFGGSITAAQFLKRFVGETPWVHLDIAGTAMGSPASDTNECWGSGWGVRLLDRLVADHYEQ